MNRKTSPPWSFLRKIARWLFWGTVVFGLYALSSGPVLRLAQSRMVPTEIAAQLYFSPLSPLGLAMNAVPGVEAALHGYLSLWALPDPDSKKPQAASTKAR